MSFKTTGVLAVILVALGAFWYFYDYKGEAPREAKAKLAKRMFQFDPGRVRRVFVATGDTMVVCERQPDSTWVITSPVQTGADRWTVDLIASNVAELDRQETIAEKATPEALADYGLRPPSFRVYLDGAGIDTLLAGDESPTGGFTYVKLAGKPEVLAVGAWQVNRMRKTLYDLRDKTVLPFDRERVTKIELIRPDSTVVCERDASGAWNVVRPFGKALDRERGDALLAALHGLRARAFVAESVDPPAQYGFDRPPLTVRLSGQEGPILTLTLGKKVGEHLYARVDRKATVYEVDERTFQDLWPPLKDRLPATAARPDSGKKG